MALSILSEAPVSLSSSANQHNILTPINWDNPLEILKLRENETIYSEGDAPQGLYFVKSGCVKIVQNRKLVRGRVHSPEYLTKLVGPGEFFGFSPLVKGGAHKSFAKTIRSSEIYIYNKEAVAQVMTGPNTLIKMLLNQVVKDLENDERNNQLHYLASVQERIAYQLLVLANRFGVSTPQGTLINLRLTRNELAQLAGTINESLSRHLTEMKNEGIIELNGKEILIKNPQALMARSGNFSIEKS